MGYNFLLLLASAIWGFGFVAQRFGMTHLGPFAFTGVRFLIGAVSLMPLCWYYYRQGKFANLTKANLFKAGIPTGGFLLVAISLQQVGLVYTTATKAGFITSLYVILVPILGIYLKQKTSFNIWVGCLIAIAGLYLISVGSDLTINIGDVLQLIGAFFWAAHILTIDHFSKKVSPVLLAFIQFFVCGIVSLTISVFIESPTLSNVLLSWKPLLYSGVMAVGVAYTIQVIAQKHTLPTHAAIILSLEGVFAAWGGVWFLEEELTPRLLIGCGFMLIGILITQINRKTLDKQIQ